MPILVVAAQSGARESTMTDSVDNRSGAARRDFLALSVGGIAATMVPATASLAQGSISRQRTGDFGPGVPTVTPVVSCHAGLFQGLAIDGISHFRGIRYGEAPVGALRWMSPRPAKPAIGIFDCSEFGAPAMQMASGTTVNHVNDFGMQMHRVFSTPSLMKVQNEDCLFLNVWTPNADAQRRPVMVWIHGGGYAYGSGADPVYQADGLARAGDVVAVSLNHRLNVFGYLQLDQAMGETYSASGTVGMQDLVLALQWIRDNIEAFGGDPRNVTIMGQSGGGAKVSILMAMPSAKGLFHKACIQSGPGLTVGRKGPAQAAASRLLHALAIRDGDVDRLRGVPGQALLAASAALGGGPGSSGPGAGPVLDGVVIPRDPFLTDAPAISADVPIIVGWTKDEWTLFTASEPWFGNMTEADLQQRITPLGAGGQALLAAYRRAYPSYSPTYLYEQILSGRVMAGSELLAAHKVAQGAAPAYVYMMAWESPAASGIFKSPHTMEIPFMLYSYDKVRTFVGQGSAPARMAAQIGGAWVAFARTGSPNHRGIPAWPAYNTQQRPVMVFNTASKVTNDPLPEVRQVFEKNPALTTFRG